jgi:hypothetical protein
MTFVRQGPRRDFFRFPAMRVLAALLLVFLAVVAGFSPPGAC